jgi:hypothetical protein
MTGRETRPRTLAVGLAVCAGLGVLSGCTAPAIGYIDPAVPAGSFQLVAFDSCDDALTGLRTAAKAIVTPYGLGPLTAVAEDAAAGAPPPMDADAARGGAEAPDAAPGAAPPNAGAPNYSGTNTHEAGVDEPDLVKTDGRRIVTVSGGVLRVIDAAGRYLTGQVDLGGPAGEGDLVRFVGADLLLAGDKALVLMDQQYGAFGGPVMQGRAVDAPAIIDGAPGAAPPIDPANPRDWPIIGPRLILVDLAGTPRVLSAFRIDGGLVDARQVGAIARVVVRSSPRISFPYDSFPSSEKATDADRLEANRAIIDKAGVEEWLPRIEVSTAGRTDRPQIDCAAISRPAVYSGTNLLTVLTFDLADPDLWRTGLGDGRPATLTADGDTVYSNGPSLYIASDQRWQMAMIAPRGDRPASQERTEIYKFDTSSAGRPAFVAGGNVPGYLINQYAMSEWQGHLRAATTWSAANSAGKTQSGIHVLAQDGRKLTTIGSVEGLGKGEQIYAVRFTGPIGYVVTFRQVDPLYTVDLGDPKNPIVRGELKIPGYSAYLHPAGGTRLIGIGQNADNFGRVRGTQISLFDVADLSAPGRLAAYTLSGANSEAEFDPHAFLYWAPEGLLVVPLQAYDRGPEFDPGAGTPRLATPPMVGALLLRVTDRSISELGFVTHPGSLSDRSYSAQIRRSLVIGQTLWTVSDGGLMAHDIRTLAQLTWIGYA